MIQNDITSARCVCYNLAFILYRKHRDTMVVYVGTGIVIHSETRNHSSVEKFNRVGMYISRNDRQNWLPNVPLLIYNQH